MSLYLYIHTYVCIYAATVTTDTSSSLPSRCGHDGRRVAELEAGAEAQHLGAEHSKTLGPLGMDLICIQVCIYIYVHMYMYMYMCACTDVYLRIGIPGPQKYVT